MVTDPLISQPPKRLQLSQQFCMHTQVPISQGMYNLDEKKVKKNF